MGDFATTTKIDAVTDTCGTPSDYRPSRMEVQEVQGVAMAEAVHIAINQ